MEERIIELAKVFKDTKPEFKPWHPSTGDHVYAMRQWDRMVLSTAVAFGVDVAPDFLTLSGYYD